MLSLKESMLFCAFCKAATISSYLGFKISSCLVIDYITTRRISSIAIKFFYLTLLLPSLLTSLFKSLLLVLLFLSLDYLLFLGRLIRDSSLILLQVLIVCLEIMHANFKVLTLFRTLFSKVLVHLSTLIYRYG